MGSIDSKVSDLLGKMGWSTPEYAQDMDMPALADYLQEYKLEVVLPRHAPQLDLSIGDKKQAMYPRPAFIHEGYKMHMAFIGPSSACKKQFAEVLPKMAHAFTGPPVKLAPGREAVPHYFLDPIYHKLVLWELPEITFKQSAENYIRELGMLYIDCVFMLFSDKYLLSDIYCKIVVAMAIHGIPFFVICTQSSDDVSEQEMARIKNQFMQKDIHGIRIFNPNRCEDFLQTLVSDFFKEVTYNRGAGPNNKEVTDGCSEAVLGQTVRLKNLEKKPELNGRCGVCIGYNKDTDRYLARLTADGVETDISLKVSSFSVLKPKLTEQLVRIHGLVSKPELNGRYGFVDAFLRESERYRVFIPDRPGYALSIALKADNLEKVTSTQGVVPIKDQPAAKALPGSDKNSAKAPAPKSVSAAPKSSAAPAPTAAAKASSKGFDPPTRDKAFDQAAREKHIPASSSGSTNQSNSVPAEPPPFKIGTRVQVHGTSRDDLNGLYADVVLYDAASGRVEVRLDDARTLRFKPANLRAVADEPSAEAQDSRKKAEESAESGKEDVGKSDLDAKLAEDLPAQFEEKAEPKVETQPARGEEQGDDDLMSRMFNAEQSMDEPAGMEDEKEAAEEAQRAAAQEEAEASQPSAASPGAATKAATSSAGPVRRQRLQLSLKGLLAMRVWAVVGDPDEAEEIIDHLMDCGKTVFSVSSSSGAHFASTAELNSNPGLPKAEVMAFVEPAEAEVVQAGAEDAARLGLRGVLLHPEAAEFSPDAMELCRNAGVTVHAADILSEVEPGAGLAVAPLD